MQCLSRVGPTRSGVLRARQIPSTYSYAGVHGAVRAKQKRIRSARKPVSSRRRVGRLSRKDAAVGARKSADVKI